MSALLHRFVFPLRDDGTDAVLSLPRDLTKAEAERLSVYVDAIAGGGQ